MPLLDVLNTVVKKIHLGTRCIVSNHLKPLFIRFDIILIGQPSDWHCHLKPRQNWEDTSKATTEVEDSEADNREIQSPASRIYGVTALQVAISLGLANIASTLLKEAHDSDAVNYSINTALSVVMEKYIKTEVEFLVNSDAGVDLTLDYGQAILLVVVERDWDNVANTIAEQAGLTSMYNESDTVPDQIQLLLAAYYGNDKEAQRVAEQPDIDLRTKDHSVGACALLLAVERGHAHVVESLLDAGVGVDSKDTSGQTSLHRATRRKSESLMRLLLEKGAEVDCKNDDGRTPFSANARYIAENHLRLLLDAGADPNTKGHDGISELYEAAAKGEVEYVKILLKCGTKPSIKTRYHWTPLHWASNNGCVEVVKLLIQAGAELSPVSDQNSTPLDMAIRAKQSVIVDLLSLAGAKESRDVLGERVKTTPEAALGKTEKTGEPVDIYSIPFFEPPADNKGPPKKLSLVFDKPLGEKLIIGQFIYPSNFSETDEYYYHISYPLDTFTTSISIRHTNRRANMVDYPIGPEKFFPTNLLYSIIRITMDYQELELRATTPNAFPKTIKMQRSQTGSWKIYLVHEGTTRLLFLTMPDWSKLKDEGCRWMTDDGKLLAKTGLEGAKIVEGAGTPILTIEQGLEKDMQDLLVSCWVAKLWSELVTLQKREG